MCLLLLVMSLLCAYHPWETIVLCLKKLVLILQPSVNKWWVEISTKICYVDSVTQYIFLQTLKLIHVVLKTFIDGYFQQIVMWIYRNRHHQKASFVEARDSGSGFTMENKTYTSTEQFHVEMEPSSTLKAKNADGMEMQGISHGNNHA